MSTVVTKAKAPAKAKTIAYWTATGVLVFCMTGGVFELLGAKTTMDVLQG